MLKRKQVDAEKSRRRRFPVFKTAVFVAVAVLLGPTVYTNITTRQNRYEPNKIALERIPARDSAIVFGAGLYDEGRELTPYLRWRVETAVELYKAGKVKTILMSGARMSAKHDEPRVMARVAQELGVPPEVVVQDGLGLDTYDSCQRAHTKYGINSAIAITQGYHLPRAVLSCQKSGIDTIGVNAHTQVRSWRAGWYLVREWLATDKLFVQLLAHRYL